MADQTQATCVYRLDREYRITFLNPDWTFFASDNEATGLEPEKVLGTLIWDHISDEETKALYRAILARVSEVNTEFRFPFRCDSPKSRRFMALTVTHRTDDSYEFSSVLLRSENRAFQRLLAPEVPRNDQVLVCCAWCKKFSLPDNRWVEVEEVVTELELFVPSTLPQISHSICPACKSDLLTSLDGLEGLTA